MIDHLPQVETANERTIPNYDVAGVLIVRRHRGAYAFDLNWVDAFDRKPDMAAENIGHALCYHSPGSGRGFAPPARGRLDRVAVLSEPGSTRARHRSEERRV